MMPDRKKVAKGLEYCSIGACAGKECPYYHDVMKDAITGCDCTTELVRDAIALLEEHGWISVNDRLPNCNGCYLVWRPRFYAEKGMPSICYFDGQNTWHDSYGVDFTRILKPEDVSHWKPLPEQP